MRMVNAVVLWVVIDDCPSAWEEIHEVFGDGHDYDWALLGDEEAVFEEEQAKPEMKYQDVSTC